MSGLQNIPIRWPDRYDPVFMDRIFREVLAKADVRNAIEGAGIAISGTPDENATIAASADVLALTTASLLTATDESGTLENSRRLVGGTGITLADAGAGDTLTITLDSVSLDQLQQIPTASFLGNVDPDGDFGPVQAIWTEDDDVLIRKMSSGLDYGKLWAEAFPDDMVTALDGDDFDIDVTSLTLSNGTFTINQAAGVSSLIIDGDVGDTTTPIIHIRNFDDSGVDRRLLRIDEVDESGGIWIDADVSGNDEENALQFGSGYSGALDPFLTLRVDGHIIAAQGGFDYDPDADDTDYDTLHITTGDHVGLKLTGDSDAVLWLEADADNATESHNSRIIFSQDGGNVLAYVGQAGDANTDSSGGAFTGSVANDFTLHQLYSLAGFSLGVNGSVGLRLSQNNDVEIIRGNTLTIYDSGTADFLRFLHDGSLGYVREGGGGGIVFQDETTTKFYLDFSNSLVRIHDGYGLRIQNSADTDWLLMSHDGTNFNFDATNTIGVYFEGQTLVGFRGSNSGIRIYDATNTDELRIYHDGSNANLSTNAGNLVLNGATVRCNPGVAFRVFDSGNTDYLQLFHDGDHGYITGVNTSNLMLTGMAAVTLLGGSQVLDIRDGSSLRIRDAGDTDWILMSHDGSNFNFAFTNTAEVIFSGAGGYSFDDTVTISAPTSLVVTSTAPNIYWIENDASADSGEWYIVASGNQLRFRMREDGGGGDISWLDVSRSAAIPSTVSFENLSNGVRIFDGSWFRVYDSGNTDYISLYESGTGSFIESNANSIGIFPGGTTVAVFDPVGSVRFPNISTTGSAANAFLDAGNANSLLRSTSSRRYKQDIQPLNRADVDVIRHLEPITFRSRVKTDDRRRRHFGLIAEQVAEVDPRLVHFDDRGRPDGVQYDRIIVPLIAKSRELENRIEKLERRLDNRLAA